MHSHIQRLIQEALDTSEVFRDADGDYPFRQGSAAYLIRVLPEPPARILIFAPIVRDVPKTPELLDELNSINARMETGHVFWHDEDVIAATKTLTENLDLAGLSYAAEAIVSTAVEVGPLISAVYGGSTFFPTADKKDDG